MGRIIKVFSNNQLEANGQLYQCAVGKSGIFFGKDKLEGDGATPTGIFEIRRIWYRGDRVDVPELNFPTRAIKPNDGWCDEPTDPNYNRHVELPYPASTESLWRSDELYDLVLELGYNDNPVAPGKGSAVFMHLAKLGYPATLGCVAVKLSDLLAIIIQADTNTRVEIVDYPQVS